MDSGRDTVMVVEDDERVLTFTSLVLRNAGFRVLEAHDGPEALRVSERFTGTIGVLVVDVVLPSMGGAEVAEQILRARPATPVIYISGYGRDEMPSGRAISADRAILEKPFTPQVLLAQVRDALVS